MIRAVGKIEGERVKVQFKNGVVLTPFDPLLDYLLENPEPLGGTYWPEKFDPINVYYTLKDRYFDELEKLEVDGDLGEIPQPEGSDTIY